MSVTLVDLGLGNIHSVVQALTRAGAEPRVTVDPRDIAGAERVVVPGQGAFRDGAKALESGFGDELRAFLETGRPYLGICLGMQLLFEGSDEAPGAEGLAFFQGRVRRFASDLQSDGRALKVPHMGWASVRSEHAFIDDGGWYYFVHSYHCQPERDIGVGVAQYGGAFCAAVAQGATFACQFHPEKSHLRGQRLLQRFAKS